MTEIFIINEINSSYKSVCLDNQIAWMEIEGVQTIIAVGSSKQWHSTQPLPQTAVLVDLVKASSKKDGNTSVLWWEFIKHLFHKSKPNFWQKIKIRFTGIHIKVSISDPLVKRDVEKALMLAKPFPLKLIR
jgi:hypothetical protein